MALTFPTLLDLLDHGHDTVIDVRSPAEYAEDHIPGAINLPVLDNEERAEVGTMYVQQSPFRARKIGAAKVFRNAADHIAGPLADKPGSWKPLVYCWRGGQRSGAFGWMLREIGWRAETLAGGYQSYRRLIHEALYEGVVPHRLVLIDGNTGTAKTEILGRLAARGAQVIDLEGLANHRGSLLGEMPGGQPSQKAFESRLACALASLDPDRPVLLEAESNKIGGRLVPPALWAAMKGAPRIELIVPVDVRAAYLARAYDDILSDGQGMVEKLAPLVRVRGREVIDGWRALIEAGDKTGLTQALIEQHYDPAYAKSRRDRGAEAMAQVASRRLDETGQIQLVAEIEGILAGRS